MLRARYQLLSLSTSVWGRARTALLGAFVVRLHRHGVVTGPSPFLGCQSSSPDYETAPTVTAMRAAASCLRDGRVYEFDLCGRAFRPVVRLRSCVCDLLPVHRGRAVRSETAQTFKLRSAGSSTTWAARTGSGTMCRDAFKLERILLLNMRVFLLLFALMHRNPLFLDRPNVFLSLLGTSYTCIH